MSKAAAKRKTEQPIESLKEETETIDSLEEQENDLQEPKAKMTEEQWRGKQNKFLGYELTDKQWRSWKEMFFEKDDTKKELFEEMKQYCVIRNEPIPGITQNSTMHAKDWIEYVRSFNIDVEKKKVGKGGICCSITPWKGCSFAPSIQFGKTSDPLWSQFGAGQQCDSKKLPVGDPKRWDILVSTKNKEDVTMFGNALKKKITCMAILNRYEWNSSKDPKRTVTVDSMIEQIEKGEFMSNKKDKDGKEHPPNIKFKFQAEPNDSGFKGSVYLQKFDKVINGKPSFKETVGTSADIHKVEKLQCFIVSQLSFIYFHDSRIGPVFNAQKIYSVIKPRNQEATTIADDSVDVQACNDMESGAHEPSDNNDPNDTNPPPQQQQQNKDALVYNSQLQGQNNDGGFDRDEYAPDDVPV